MKNVYLIGGTMGVGKTTVCQLLKSELNNSVFLDGDWCWDMNPFRVTDETKMMVVDNICHQLNNFIRCSVYDNIIFCWVMHEQEIISNILDKLNIDGCDVKVISLVCNQQTLLKRLKQDIESNIRAVDVLDKSMGYLTLYEQLDTNKIDVTESSPIEVVKQIMKL